MIALPISKAARAAGVSVETIRFYEREKMIEQPPRPTGGMRRYPPDIIERVHFIREAQQLGFTLREVRDLLTLKTDPASDCAEVRKRAAAKLDEVRRKIEQLQRIGDALQSLIAACPAHGRLEVCTVMSALAGPQVPCDGTCDTSSNLRGDA